VLKVSRGRKGNKVFRVRRETWVLKGCKEWLVSAASKAHKV